MDRRIQVQPPAKGRYTIRTYKVPAKAHGASKAWYDRRLGKSYRAGCGPHAHSISGMTMASVVSIKFSEEEAHLMRRAHAASGVIGVSSHIKQVYFDALRLDAGALQAVRGDLDRIESSVARLLGSEDGRGDPDLMLSILCGLYLMVRKSVGDSIRAQADSMLDVAAIESYLRGR